MREWGVIGSNVVDGIERESSEKDPGVMVDEASACHTVEYMGFVGSQF